MRRKFYKMQAVGNDYLYFNCMHKGITFPSRLAIKLSARHFSVGGDGIILICKSSVAVAKMRIFNADGSEGKTCGNGIRCVAKFLYDFGYTNKKSFCIETASGVSKVSLCVGSDGKVKTVTVDMGQAQFEGEKIPVNLSGQIIARKLVVFGKGYTLTCVNVGNPHCVVFGNLPQNVSARGEEIAKSGLFPQGANIEFAEKISEREFRVRVYERGSGETLSCGSGACAVVAAAVVNGLAKESEDVYVRLRGGTLKVNYTKDRILLTGEAVFVFEGVVPV